MKVDSQANIRHTLEVSGLQQANHTPCFFFGFAGFGNQSWLGLNGFSLFYGMGLGVHFYRDC
jgi:hypothetical protein